MSEYTVFTFGSEAIAYIQDYLKNFGKSLANLVLEKIDLKAGNATTAIPEKRNLYYIDCFDDGGFLLDTPEPKLAIYDEIFYDPAPEVDSHAVDTIKDFLNIGSARICVFVDHDMRPTDPLMGNLSTHWESFGDEVYHLLIGTGHTNEKIRDTMSWAEGIWSICVLTSLPSKDHNFFTDNKLTKEVIETMAERTEKLIFLAYDGEGYLIWHRTPQE